MEAPLVAGKERMAIEEVVRKRAGGQPHLHDRRELTMLGRRLEGEQRATESGSSRLWLPLRTRKCMQEARE